MPNFKKTTISQEVEEQILAELQATISPEVLDQNWIEIRITDLDGSVTTEKINQFCMTLSSTYLFCREIGKKVHFHLAIPLSGTPKRGEITALIYDYFQCEYNEDKSRTGNASHKSKNVENLPCYLTYITKDGDYHSSGFSQEILDFLYSNSFKKTTMTDEVEELCKKYINSEISKEEMAEGVIIARAEKGCYSLTDSQKIINSIEIVKNPMLARELAIEKIKYLS